MARFTDKEVRSLQRLVPYAKRKMFVASLILNAYSSDNLVDMRSVMRYAAGEPGDSTYRADVLVLLDLMARGVESHELLGESVLDALREIWGWGG